MPLSIPHLFNCHSIVVGHPFPNRLKDDRAGGEYLMTELIVGIKELAEPDKDFKGCIPTDLGVGSDEQADQV